MGSPDVGRGAMAIVATNDPKGATGYRMDQLASAFDRVRDPRDWMAPIRAVIQAGDQSVVEKAVLWFTDTVARFEPEPGMADRLIVIAAGYRLGLARRDGGGAMRETVFISNMPVDVALAGGHPQLELPPSHVIGPVMSGSDRGMGVSLQPTLTWRASMIKPYGVFLTWRPRWKNRDPSIGGIA